MPAKESSKSAPARPKKSSAAGDAYLLIYNAASAILWAAVLGRVAVTYTIRGPEFVPLVVMNFARWTQTLAGLEILHVALGASPLSRPVSEPVRSAVAGDCRAPRVLAQRSLCLC